MDAPLQKPEKSTDTGRTVRIKEEVNQEYTKDKDMLKMHILFFLCPKRARCSPPELWRRCRSGGGRAGKAGTVCPVEEE